MYLLPTHHILQVLIYPCSNWIILHYTHIWAGESAILSAEHIGQFHTFSSRGLLCLHHLQRIFPASKDDHLFSFTTCLASFTDSRDVWTCRSSHEVSNALIDSLRDMLKECDFEAILARLLREKVKPAFDRTQSRKLTPQSRKAINPWPITASILGDDPESKPWKYKDVYIPTVLQWVMHQAQELPVSHWSLPTHEIPTLLTFDERGSSKRIGR